MEWITGEGVWGACRIPRSLPELLNPTAFPSCLEPTLQVPLLQAGSRGPAAGGGSPPPFFITCLCLSQPRSAPCPVSSWGLASCCQLPHSPNPIGLPCRLHFVLTGTVSSVSHPALFGPGLAGSLPTIWGPHSSATTKIVLFQFHNGAKEVLIL